MAGDETASISMPEGAISDCVRTVLLGPISKYIFKSTDPAMRNEAIRAVWRNETGDAK